MILKSKIMTFVFTISFLYILPIIITGTYYYDDLNRALTGYGWSQDGRFVATIVMTIMSFGSILIPPYPLTIILSAIIIIISGEILNRALLHSENKNGWTIGLLLLTSPFYIENLSYRYDSVPMSLSILFSIVPFLFIKNKAFPVISILCLFMSFGLYQTSVMIYPVLTGCFILKSAIYNERLEIKKYIVTPIACLVLSYFIYYFAIKLIGNVPHRSSTLPISMSSISIIKSRVFEYIHLFLSLLRSRYIIPASFFLAVVTYITSISFYKHKIKYLKVIIITYLLTALIMCAMSLPNIILETMFVTPRTMVVFPFIFLPWLMLSELHRDNVTKTIILIFIFTITLYSFILISAFSESIKNNDEYSKFIGDNVYSDLSTLEIKNEYTVSTIGQPLPPIRNKILYNELPILHYLSPVYIKPGSYWANLSLFKYKRVYNNDRDRKDNNLECDNALIIRKGIYTIYSDGENITISFDDSCW